MILTQEQILAVFMGAKEAVKVNPNDIVGNTIILMWEYAEQLRKELLEASQKITLLELIDCTPVMNITPELSEYLTKFSKREGA